MKWVSIINLKMKILTYFCDNSEWLHFRNNWCLNFFLEFLKMKTCTWLKDCPKTKRDMGSFVWKVCMLILIKWAFGFHCSEDCIIRNKVQQKMGINQFKLFNFKTCAWLKFWKLGVCHSMCQFMGWLNAIVAKHYLTNNF